MSRLNKPLKCCLTEITMNDNYLSQSAKHHSIG